MKLIVCLDDRNGMLFNKRRQSADRVLSQRILELVGEGFLWMNGYSRKLFDETAENIRVDDRFLELAGKNDYCFAENVDVTSYINRADTVMLFRWNRAYPADMYFPMELITGSWKKVESIEFAGSSHEKITQEVYER